MRKFPIQCLALAALGFTAQAWAVDGLYTGASAFSAAAGPLQAESFEGLAGRSLALTPVLTPGFTLSSDAPLLGIQTGPNTPGSGFGAFGTLGPTYVLVYQPGQPTGTIVFSFAAPVTAFGLDLTDLGETDGQLQIRTNVGAFASATTALSWPPTGPSGQTNFVGLTQNQAFTQVFVTVTGVDEAFGLDNVRVSAVPEPSTLLMMALGALGLTGWASRRKSGTDTH